MTCPRAFSRSSKLRFIVFIGAFFLFGILSGTSAYSQDKPIRIKPQFLKIPIAVPEFHPIPDTPAGRDIARKAHKMMKDTISFTGLFYLLNKNTFPHDYDASVPDKGLESWIKTGAHYLITGALKLESGIVAMEFRLYAVHEKQMLKGKFYKSWISNQRKIIRKFCNEVVYQITGSPGLFESKIAFVSTGPGTKEIFICDFDGSNPVQFTKNKSINLFPAWSKDGEWIAYTSFARSNPDIFIRNFKQKSGYHVSRKGINTTPAWVPGESKLAATMSFEGNQEIYMLTREGKPVKRLTQNWGIDTSPTFSPDGKKMAFVSNRGGTPQIYIKNLRTEKEERLTFKGRYNTQPEWSPKGDKIAYSAMSKTEIDICVINEDGSGFSKLTGGSGKNESPSWSPDGSMIIFSSSREGSPKLYVMTSYGTEQRRLLTLPGEQTSPDWSPAWVDQ